jgi:hypothetical protein
MMEEKTARSTDKVEKSVKPTLPVAPKKKVRLH